MPKKNAATSLGWKDVWMLVDTYSELIDALKHVRGANAKKLKGMLNQLIEVEVKMQAGASTKTVMRNLLYDLWIYLSSDNPTLRGIDALGKRGVFVVPGLVNSFMGRSAIDHLTPADTQLIDELIRSLPLPVALRDDDRTIQLVRKQIIAVNWLVAQDAALLVEDMHKKPEKWRTDFSALKAEIERQVQVVVNASEPSMRAESSSSPSSSSASASTSSSYAISSEYRARSGNVFSWEGNPFLSQSSPGLAEGLKGSGLVLRDSSNPELSSVRKGRVLKRQDAIKYNLSVPLLDLREALNNVGVSPLAPRRGMYGADSLSSSSGSPEAPQAITRKKKKKPDSAPATPTAEDGYEAEREAAPDRFGLFAKASSQPQRISSPDILTPRGRKKS